MNELLERERKFREEFSHGLMAEQRGFLEESFSRERIFREEFSHGLAKEMRYYNNLALRYSIPQFYNEAGKILVHTNDGQRFFLDARETFMALHVMETGEWETKIRKVMALILTSGATFIDIGANIGLHALYGAALVGGQGQVIAVEPSPRTFSFLQQNIELNGLEHIIKALCLAASDSAGEEVKFEYFSQHPGMSGFHLPTERVKKFNATPETIVVKTTTLNELLTPDCKADLIKIDVEGFELKVLEGAKKIISEDSDACFLIEYEPAIVRSVLGPDACKELEGLFERNNYMPFVVTDERLIKMDYSDFAAYTTGDILFIPHESKHLPKVLNSLK